MPRRLVSVDDAFNVPDSVNIQEENLPDNLQPAALNAANLAQITAEATSPQGVLRRSFAGSGTAQTAGASLPNFSKALRDYNDANPTPIRVITLGSSVMYGAAVEGNTLAMRLNTKLQETFNQSGLRTINVTNGGVNGSTVASGLDTDYELAKTAAGGTPKLVVMGYGMNEGGFGQYHSGITYGGVYGAFRKLIARCQKDGADVVVMTTPHPNPTNYPWGYAGPTGYPRNSSNVAVILPAPDRASSTIVADRAGTGTANVEAHYRYIRVNQAMRQAAWDAGAAVIDTEKYWFEAVAKHGVTSLYTGNEYVHPNLLGHQESYWRGMDDFFRDLTRAKIAAPVVSEYGPVDFRAIGEKGLNMTNGQVFTLDLPADTVGELTLYGTAGGGWQGSATCRVTTRPNRAGVSALVKANASTSADIIASIAASTTAPQVTVTTATTGTGGAFTWVYRYFSVA